ncbi:MAG: hypothetical protein Q7K41_06940 [Dehalococcoidales bacterium]|nr:hypothetical protein [Dehalococcoidales bacterium]
MTRVTIIVKPAIVGCGIRKVNVSGDSSVIAGSVSNEAGTIPTALGKTGVSTDSISNRIDDAVHRKQWDIW